MWQWRIKKAPQQVWNLHKRRYCQWESKQVKGDGHERACIPINPINPYFIHIYIHICISIYIYTHTNICICKYVYTPLIPIAAPLGATRSWSGAQPCTGASEWSKKYRSQFCEAEGNHGFSYEICVFHVFFPVSNFDMPMIFPSYSYISSRKKSSTRQGNYWDSYEIL